MDLNQLSLILYLEAHPGPVAVDVLLAADTDGERLNGALAHLSTRRAKEGRNAPAPVRLDMVKVAHHGSAASHHGSWICGHGKSGCKRVAVVSVGTKFAVLPDREVLSDFLECGWRVLATNKRTGAIRRPHAAAVSSVRRSGSVNYTVRSQDVILRWDADGLRWEPAEAEVSHGELRHYEGRSL